MPIHYEKDDEHIVLITIDRPEAKNSADMEHFKLLRESWDRFDADPDAWVAIITGVDESFCVGADLKTYIPQVTDLQRKIASGEVTEIDGCKLSDGTYAVLRNVKIYKPIIGAINGPCAGFGVARQIQRQVDRGIRDRRQTFADFHQRSRFNSLDQLNENSIKNPDLLFVQAISFAQE